MSKAEVFCPGDMIRLLTNGDTKVYRFPFVIGDRYYLPLSPADVAGELHRDSGPILTLAVSRRNVLVIQGHVIGWVDGDFITKECM